MPRLLVLCWDGSARSPSTELSWDGMEARRVTFPSTGSGRHQYVASIASCNVLMTTVRSKGAELRTLNDLKM